MAKKNKDDAPNPNSVSNRDILQRMNFLYQASAYLKTVATQQEAYPETQKISGARTQTMEKVKEEGRSKKGKRQKEIRDVTDLSITYIRSMKAIGKRTTVRLYVSLTSWPVST